jgi:hypothetical protein
LKLLGLAISLKLDKCLILVPFLNGGTAAPTESTRQLNGGGSISMSSAFLIEVRRSIATIATLAAVCIPCGQASGQFFRQPSVGGVKIDTDGVISNPQVAELKQLQAAWQKGLEPVPADLQKWADLRFVSLKQLESEVAAARAGGKPLPEAVRYMAGLQRVTYVLVYPDKQDIVLAGPAEGWKVDSLGCVVGATSNCPVLTLDDLMVALRVAESSNQSGISCSIDPTPEGLRRMQQLNRKLSSNPQVASRQMEEAVGLQTVSVSGVPATSHLARVIVAADFRMKRLAMNMERAPVDGMPSYLSMIRGGGSQSLMPRFWLAPKYEPVRRDNDGLAWEIRGQAVQCMTEQDFMDKQGEKQHSGKADPTAQRWADNFTSKFEELAHEDSSFGQLRNVMDLAVVGALLVKERLVEKANFQAPNLMVDQPLVEFPAPKAVPSQASFVRAGRHWVVSVSGGVQIFPWQVADRTEVFKDLASARPQLPASKSWYWQR